MPNTSPPQGGRARRKTRRPVLVGLRASRKVEPWPAGGPKVGFWVWLVVGLRGVTQTIVAAARYPSHP